MPIKFRESKWLLTVAKTLDKFYMLFNKCKKISKMVLMSNIERAMMETPGVKTMKTWVITKKATLTTRPKLMEITIKILMSEEITNTVLKVTLCTDNSIKI